MKLLFWQYCLYFGRRLNLKRGDVCTSADEHEGEANCLPGWRCETVLESGMKCVTADECEEGVNCLQGWKCEAARMGAGERCEMRNVVNACIDAGIRDDIIIMVGSAGDTCDDI